MAEVFEGEIVLARLSQADGGAKLRPIILLRKLPGMGDFFGWQHYPDNTDAHPAPNHRENQGQ